MTAMQKLYLLVPLAPLAGALIAGLLGWMIGRRASHWVTITGMVVCLVASFLVYQDVMRGNVFNGPIYTWLVSGNIRFELGFLIDPLSATMMMVVSFVSLMVHIYTIGYMADDPGYQRFFSYISLFTFSMLMLVMSNNFLQLFFGWEAVGLVSYLLIGFWYTRPTAIYANLKAFLVNRVGDFGFLLGIALVLMYFGSLDYAAVFANAGRLADNTVELFPGVSWSLMTVICILLFIGAMGKSAQFPLHVWLPDSMEGPTPISALIHAATMVTAGIFMVARMSPLFELSETALSFVLVIGAITAFFMALIATVQYDIKRVVAYSTLSQLGYMTMALGASAYSAAIFHLFTHAFFKAVLFLGAGSVIIAMHHQQDMRKMGGLAKYMPITYMTMLIGALANAGLPPFAGFFSKDTIIEAIHHATVPGTGFAFVLAVAGVFVGGFYSFRLMFYTFHGKERFADPHDPDARAADADAKAAAQHDDHAHDDHGHDSHSHAPHESPAVVWVPLVLLAIPSVCAGWFIGTIVYGNYFGSSIMVSPAHPALAVLTQDFPGVMGMMEHALATQPFWLAVAGAGTAWFIYIVRPELPGILRRKWGVLVTILMEKYGFDRFNDWFFAGGARALGTGLWKGGDVAVIDNVMVNGSARLVGWFAAVVRHVQSGYIYHYAFAMIIGVLLLLTLAFIG
ncbi:MAG: NADH-quinone oxidoreductase subunit L [Betaproteobacteria bacterium]|jgi:NADH-quinone oxidoreductase subunit L|nr:NADH-quinone oxidoreductase subunit L [Betaproteobacteria bacterium]MDH5342177.1 NADH-quinone oxidoreductase subunit L [Betaproteobacteria bacterium]